VRVIITGGGTAGHVYPGLATADKVKQLIPGTDILFVGTSKGLEAKIVPKAGYSFTSINIKGLKRKVSLDVFKTIFSFIAGCYRAIKIIKKFQPDVVLGTGGYVSAPMVAMAILLKIPTIIHEQNSIPGLTNKLLGKRANIVAITFPCSEKFFKRDCIVTGNPIRKEILKAKREDALDFFSVESNRKTLLVFGGSQGSRCINESLVDAYNRFRNFDNLQIIHITGKIDFEKISKQLEVQKRPQDKLLYNCYEYLNDIDKAYAVSDLVLCRAGATTIAEITAVGVPSILVPYPYSTGGHQEKNARVLEQEGAAKLILDEDMNGVAVFNSANEIIFNESILFKMRDNVSKLGKPNAALELAKLVKGLGEGRARGGV